MLITCFWNNLHQVHSVPKDWNNLHQVHSVPKDWNNLHQVHNNFKVFGSMKTKEPKQDNQNMLRLHMPEGGVH